MSLLISFLISPEIVVTPQTTSSTGASRDNATTPKPVADSVGIAKGAGDDTNNNAPINERQNLSGIWKRIRSENYEEFIGAQGGGYVQRKLASSVSLVHTITMNEDLSLFRLQVSCTYLLLNLVIDKVLLVN